MAENAANNVIRLIVTVVVLAAAYFFIVKPILETTESTVNRAFESTDRINRQIDDSLEAAGASDVSFKTNTSSIKQGQKILRCINRAGGDVAKIQRCSP